MIHIDDLILKLGLKKVDYNINEELVGDFNDFNNADKTMESLLHIRKDGTILVQDVTTDIVTLLKNIR